MPSQLHEAVLLLFRNRPELAPALLRDVLRVDLPSYAQARIESADLTDGQPAEYRADLVVLLYDDKPVLGIIVEVQLAIDNHKHFAWPVYAVGLRARMHCPVCVLVVTPLESVARWASRPIELGGNSTFLPFAIGPSGVPEITDRVRAKVEPELAVLSAIAHGRTSNPERALEIAAAALAASVDLDPSRSVLYYDLVYASLSEAARGALRNMDPAKYEFQSDFAKRFMATLQQLEAARAQTEAAHAEIEALRAQTEAARAEGELKLLRKQLTLRFGVLSLEMEQRLAAASTDDLERWAERILSAETLEDVLR